MKATDTLVLSLIFDNGDAKGLIDGGVIARVQLRGGRVGGVCKKHRKVSGVYG